MPETIQLDSELIDEVKRFTGFDSAEAALTVVAREYIARHKMEAIRRGRQREIIKLFGTVDFDPEWDYKEQRRRDALKRIPKDDDC